MKFIALSLGLAVSLALAGNALAQVKPEDAIKYRKSVYAVMGWNFGPLAAMAKGDKPYDKDEAIRRTANIAFMSRLPLEGFIPGSDKGDTKAKPEIWENMDDFKSKLEKMQQETAKLAEVAKAGDFNALKAQLGETGKACKACHDNYRNK
jgi:cytochrome c556